MSDLNTEIKITASADGVETGVARAKRSLAGLKEEATRSGAEAGRGMAPLGEGAEAAARKVDSATRSMQNSLQRQIAALEAGGTATRQYQESLAKLRGVDANALKPLLDQLDAAKAKADRAGQGLNGLGTASSFLQGQLAALAGSLTLGSMAAFVLQINNGIDALNDIKDATGSTIENISALEDIGKRTGASLDLVGGVLIKFNDVLSKAGPKSDIALQLQAIGLSAEELKRIDPAEALLKTAQALSQYADDGNKARLIQDLFGKSVKDAAPFLADLAEKGQLVATVTSQQADEADRFNKQLFELRANANDAARNIATGLIPGLNELSVVLATAARYGNGFADSMRLIALTRFGGDGLEIGKDIAGAVKELDSLTAARERYVRSNADTTAIDMALSKERERLKYLREIQRLTFRYDANDQSSAESRRLARGPALSDEKPSIVLGPTAAEIAEQERRERERQSKAEAAARAAAALRERELKEQQKFFADLAGLSGDYYDKLAQAQKERAAGNITEAQYIEYVEQLIQKQPFATALTRDNAAAIKAQAAAAIEAAKASAAYYGAIGQDLARLEEQNQRLREEGEQIGLSAQGLLALTLARQDHAIAIEAERLALLQANEGSTEEILLQERRIALLKEQRALTAANGQRQIATDAAKEAATAWQRASDDIERSLTDALMRGFESGKGFAEVLRDTVANMFRTLVLRPIVSAIVSPVAGAITGTLGLPGAANAASGAANAIGGMGAVGSAFGALGTGLGAGASMIAGGGIGGWLGASTSLIGTGTAAGAMAGIGALAGPIGAVLAVASLLRSLDKGGTYHMGGLGSYSAAGGSAVGTAVQAQGLDFGLSPRDFRAQSEGAAVDMARAVVGLLDSTASTFGQQAGYFAATAFADDSSRSGAWGALMLRLGDKIILDWGQGADKWPGREFANGEAGAKEYAAAVAKDVRDYLITQTPEWADVMLNALGNAPTLENLSAVVAQINQAAAALDGMGRASKAFAGLSESATAALIKAIGGAEAATASLSTYYSNFYSEEERTALATARLTEQLAALGLKLPETREAFRGLVDAALAAGNTGLAASLLSLSGAFAAIKPAAQATATAVAEAAQSIQRERAGLERQLLQATGNTAALRALDLAALDESNRALQMRIWALQDEATALQTTRDIARQAQEAARQSAATMLGALEQSNQFFAGIQRNIASFVAGLDAQAGGQPGLRSAASAYSAQLAFARGGDQDALQGITGYAQTYIEAIRRESTTAAEAALQVGRVRGQLLALPGQLKPEDAIVAAIGALGETLTASFDNIDLNVNGLIDYTEFSRAFAGMASDATLKEIFSLLDTNGDGTISRLEAIKGTSLQTAENTYGLDKLARVKDVIDSLNWGTAEWDAASARTLSTVASQQGWTAQDLAQALNGRFTPEQLVQFFRQQGQDLALGGLGGFGSRTPAGGSQATTPAPGGGFVVGGGNAGASAGAANYGSAGDIQTVFAQAYINSLSWGNPQADASSTAALASYASSAGLTQADLADLLGFTPEQIQQHFAAYGIPAFAVGTNYVPRDMLALIHEGEAVVPKAYNPVAGGMDFSAFGRGMDAMAAEVRALREDNQAQARAMVQLQQRLVKLQERWDANGLPETRVEA